MFTHTPLGWFLLLVSALAIILIIRNAVVPDHQTAGIQLARRSHLEKPPEKDSHDQSDRLAVIIFIILWLGIVEWSWFGILPRLAALIGTPSSLVGRLTAAIMIGLLAGSVALAAAGIAEWLQSEKRASLARRS